jgi:putative tryptophan/tyrosine transport system substrate-binding protein
MRRREFIAALTGVAAAQSLPVWAQSPVTGRRRIELLVIGAPPPLDDLEIVKELARLGYVEGSTVDYLIASDSGDPNQSSKAAHDLLAAKPDVVVGPGTTLVYALLATVRDIPFVMTATADPVATGLSASMSRPTRNVTGFTIASTTITTKRLELLRELLPGVHKVGRLWVPVSVLAHQLGEQAQMAAARLGIELVSLPVKSGSEIASAFSIAEREQVAAIMTDPDPVSVQFDVKIADECLIRNLPLMDAWPSLVRNGAVIAYGPPGIENFKGAAIYVDRILRGTQVADLPFVEPTQVKLTINLQTARSIGLTVPANLLALADEVVE